MSSMFAYIVTNNRIALCFKADIWYTVCRHDHFLLLCSTNVMYHIYCFVCVALSFHSKAKSSSLLYIIFILWHSLWFGIVFGEHVLYLYAFIRKINKLLNIYTYFMCLLMQQALVLPLCSGLWSKLQKNLANSLEPQVAWIPVCRVF